MSIKPLNASMAPGEMPIRVYFFERPDGTIIHVDEKSAWTMYSRPQQTLTGPKKFKYLGTSNGQSYSQAVAESGSIFREHGLEAAQAFLRKAWEAELEIAKTDQTLPRNFDSIDKTGSPVNISKI